ncbi:MAG: carboxypeptidase-like regulatory domain-containing protein [Chloroflexota bacterium]
MNLHTPTIQEGEHLAYINKDASPNTVAIIENSPEQQQEITDLEKLYRSLGTFFATTKPVDPQDLVDVATGHATPNQILIVDAHCRRDPAVRAELEQIRADWIKMEEIRTRPTLFERIQNAYKSLQQYIAEPILLEPSSDFRFSARSPVHADNLRQAYEVINLDVHLTLRIIPMSGEVWKLEGFVTQNSLPVAETIVTVQASLEDGDRELDPVTTDEHGFFMLTNLEEGVYRLEIILEHGIVVVRDVELKEDEDLFL